MKGVLWIVRTGSPWRDLPDASGDWNSAFRRFSPLERQGVRWRFFDALSDDPDFDTRSSTRPSFAPTSMRQALKKGV